MGYLELTHSHLGGVSWFHVRVLENVKYLIKLIESLCMLVYANELRTYFFAYNNRTVYSYTCNYVNVCMYIWTYVYYMCITYIYIDIHVYTNKCVKQYSACVCLDVKSYASQACFSLLA